MSAAYPYVLFAWNTLTLDTYLAHSLPSSSLSSNKYISGLYYTT